MNSIKHLHLQGRCRSNKTVRVLSAISAFLLLVYLMLGVYIMTAGWRSKLLPDSFQQGIAEEILRFHVIADSDNPADQEIKLLVKDTLIDYLKPYLSAASSKEDAEKIISGQLQELEAAADQVLAAHGYSYTAKAALGKTEFPVKVYGDIALPAGTYDALCVRLGRAEGKNWWCIMFPQLCFIDGSCTIVPEESKSELQYLLTEEEYEAILLSPPKVTYKSKLFEWLASLFT